MNAAIEAGRGFAVVADAVSGLAGQSNQAADSAIDLVKNIKDAGTQTSSISSQSQLGAQEGTMVVLGAIKESEGIAIVMETMTSKVKTLTGGVERGLDEIVMVTKTIEEVSAIAEESSSASEETYSAVEEQTASVQKMAGITKDVTTITENVESSTKLVAQSAGEVAQLAESVGNDAQSVEKSTTEISEHANQVVSATETVSESALAVVMAAEKTNEHLERQIQSRTNILNTICKKYNIKTE